LPSALLTPPGRTGLAAHQVKKLNREIAEILKQKDVEEKLTQQGAIPVGDTPEHFASYIKNEIKKWGAVVKSANIKAD
jgi:tripartite-type tricarboxylate transporter receptor subunit TctC